MLEALMAAESLRVVFEYGFEIGDENFVELTGEQYSVFEEQGGDVSKRWFRLTRGIFEDRNNPPEEIPTVNEVEKHRILAAVRLVHEMTNRADRSFGDFRERLDWLAGRLPEVITGRPTTAPDRLPDGDRNGSQDAGRDQSAAPFEPHGPPGVERFLRNAEALQDDGQAASAAERLIEFIVFQSNLEAQLRAIEVLARCPTPRGLGYLRHIDQPEIAAHGKTDGIRRVLYPHAPAPLATALEHDVDLSAARGDGGRQEAVKRARRTALAHSAAHRVLQAALRKKPRGPG